MPEHAQLEKYLVYLSTVECAENFVELVYTQYTYVKTSLLCKTKICIDMQGRNLLLRRCYCNVAK